MNEQIQPKKAELIFPFMQDLNEEDDLYNENFIEDAANHDMISVEEEGFMIGYLEA